MFTETQTHPFTGTVEVWFHEDHPNGEQIIFEGWEVTQMLPGGVVFAVPTGTDRDGLACHELTFVPYARIARITQPERD